MSAREVLTAYYAPSTAIAAGSSLGEFVQALASATPDSVAVVGDKKAVPVSNKYISAAESLISSPPSVEDSAALQSTLAPLEKDIEATVYVLPGSTQPAAADVALFTALHPLLSKAPASVQHAYPSLTRYTAHLASLPAVQAAASKAGTSLPTFTPTYQGFPKIQRADPAKEKAEKAKAKEAKAAAAGAAAPAQQQQQQQQQPGSKKDKKEGKKETTDKPAEGAKASAATAAPAEDKKKEKKEKAPKQPKAPAAPARPLPSFVDLRVGKIVDVQRHPDADSLYLEKVDFGEGEPRTVLSGLVKNVPIEALKDRMVVGVCNLKPVSMRGIKSYGMLLCAVLKDGENVGVDPVFPPAGSIPGDRIYVEGYKGLQPEEQLNPKKKVFETIQPHYLTTDEKFCAWKGIGPDEDPATAEPKIRMIQSDKGPVYSDKFAGATLS